MTNVVVSAGITSFSGPRLRPVAHDLLLNHQTHRVGHGLAGIGRLSITHKKHPLPNPATRQIGESGESLVVAC